jgi:hypothetical protein
LVEEVVVEKREVKGRMSVLNIDKRGWGGRCGLWLVAFRVWKGEMREVFPVSEC